ncbi:MAG: M15 family metallopeptidase [Ginsengibacter sp.]
MVDLSNIRGIKLDLKYNTDQNFMHQKLYKGATSTYLRIGVYQALIKVQNELSEKKLGLVIWDAYRPFAVTQMMWDKIHDERYVANPKTGSGHNKGIAVDLTIIDNSGNLLPMGTDFDNFTDTAHSDFTQLNENVIHNRQLLKEVMQKYGFKNLQTEWWHFYFDDNNKYEVLNLSFHQLKRANKSLH